MSALLTTSGARKARVASLYCAGCHRLTADLGQESCAGIDGDAHPSVKLTPVWCAIVGLRKPLPSEGTER